VIQRGPVVLLESQCESIVEDGFGKPLALLVVERPLLVETYPLAELFLDLTDPLLSRLVFELVALDAAPDAESSERVALLIAALAQLQRCGTRHEQTREETQRGASHAEGSSCFAGSAPGSSTA
jgi:hypothetical protein